MSGYVEVISPGLLSTIQDLGRFGYRRYGVPVSGAMDKQSAALANHILNNRPSCALMEITISGPKLFFQTATTICISGADMSPMINDVSIGMNQPVRIRQNDILSFGSLKSGTRTYLAVKDGFQTEEVMGSRSYYFPVTQQNIIRRGDRLLINPHENETSLQSTVRSNAGLFEDINIDCTAGPEFDIIPEKEKQIITSSRFTVSRENDRMGYRLLGDPVLSPPGFSMLTSSVIAGTVQLTPSGQLIVLMQDCQTTGGYPRVLQLEQSGINRLAQRKAGDQVQFQLRG